MTPEDLSGRQLRLLFSWRGALLELDADEAGRAEQLETVERALDACRTRHRRKLEQLGKGLRTALERGEADAEAAVLRREIMAHNALLRAQSAEDLGGRISAPLPRYAAELDAMGLPWRGRSTVRPHRLLAYLSPTDRKILLALPFCLVLAVLTVLYFARWRGEARFELLEGAGVRIRCTNETASDIVLYAPWPDHAPPAEGAKHYGLHLYLQEAPGEPFRLYPSFGSGWYYHGTPTASTDAIRIAPGLSAEIQFRPGDVTLPGASSAFRIECTRENGAVLARFDFAEAAEP